MRQSHVLSSPRILSKNVPRYPEDYSRSIVLWSYFLAFFCQFHSITNVHGHHPLFLYQQFQLTANRPFLLGLRPGGPGVLLLHHTTKGLLNKEGRGGNVQSTLSNKELGPNV